MFETLLAVASFAFVSSVTPGPNNVLLTATGSKVGFWRGFPTLLGITCGFALMIFTLTLGLGSLVLGSQGALKLVTGAGVLMLVYLSYQIAFAPVMKEQGEGAKCDNNRSAGFLSAAIFQWINPKAWLVAGSAISAYMVNSYSAFNQAALFASVFFVAGLIGCLPWLAFGSLIQRLLKTERACRWFNYSMGLLLLSSIVLIVR